MSIPTQWDICVSLLRAIRDGQEHDVRHVTDRLAKEFDLQDDELRQVYKSGANRFKTVVNFAILQLKTAQWLERPRRSMIRITKTGQSILEKDIDRIDHRFLWENSASYREYREYQEERARQLRGKKTTEKQEEGLLDDEQAGEANPMERMEEMQSHLNHDLERELLEKAHKLTPAEFERLVIKLIARMGYAGGDESEIHLGRPGDDGVDGEIKQDELGIDRIYLQAKRYAEDNSVGPREIRNFSGALSEKKARRGIFITTSVFTKPAREKSGNFEGQNIVLIDGGEMAKLMRRHNVGCAVGTTYEVKEVDEDFFDNL